VAILTQAKMETTARPGPQNTIVRLPSMIARSSSCSVMQWAPPLLPRVLSGLFLPACCRFDMEKRNALAGGYLLGRIRIDG
jgi:hypothetical protein